MRPVETTEEKMAKLDRIRKRRKEIEEKKKEVFNKSLPAMPPEKKEEFEEAKKLVGEYAPYAIATPMPSPERSRIMETIEDKIHKAFESNAKDLKKDISVMLHGSYARGDFREDSDLDLLIYPKRILSDEDNAKINKAIGDLKEALKPVLGKKVHIEPMPMNPKGVTEKEVVSLIPGLASHQKADAFTQMVLQKMVLPFLPVKHIWGNEDVHKEFIEEKEEAKKDLVLYALGEKGKTGIGQDVLEYLINEYENRLKEDGLRTGIDLLERIKTFDEVGLETEREREKIRNKLHFIVPEVVKTLKQLAREKKIELHLDKKAGVYKINVKEHAKKLDLNKPSSFDMF